VYKYVIVAKVSKESEELSTTDQMGQSALATSITTVVLTTAMTGASSQVWGLINGLQLVVHLPLIKLATFP